MSTGLHWVERTASVSAEGVDWVLDLTLHLSGIPSMSRDVLNRKLLLREDEL